MNKEIMSIVGISRYLGFSQRKIYQLIKEGKIPVSKIGGQYRFIKDEIYLWLRRSKPTNKLNNIDLVNKIKKACEEKTADELNNILKEISNEKT